MNAAFNAGAIEADGRILLVVRVEGWDRKSFFAVAESPNGVDNFRFWDEPVFMLETADHVVWRRLMGIGLHVQACSGSPQ